MRYIDADALIKKIYPMGIGDGKYTINAKAVKLAIDNTPTADVVPKSEVDLYRKQIDELEDKLETGKSEVERLKAQIDYMLVSEQCEVHIPMEYFFRVRTEHPIFKGIEEKVAREIFAEIEKHGRKMQSSDFSGDFWDIAVLMSDIAELKKKYIHRECPKCKYFVGCEKANWVRGCDEYTEGEV